MSRIQKIYMLIAICLVVFADVLGAYGTHALQTHLDERAIAAFKTGVQYQFYHGLFLLILSLLMFHIKNKWMLISGLSLIIGIILFSGSLYGLSIMGLKWGLITPLGGLFLILGGVFGGVAVIRAK